VSERIRVLVVDDSAFARKVMRDVLTTDARMDVVAIARDGLEALERITALDPDVITLDLVMPNLDGVGVLRALDADMRRRVVVVSMSDAESELGIEALQLGAFDLVHKPSTLATVRLYDLSAELIAKVAAVAATRVTRAAHSADALANDAADAAEVRAVTRSPTPPPLDGAPEIVVIGTSTGGPQALTRLLTKLPADFPVPLAIALHIPAGYTETLARRLDAACAISVAEAAEGLELRPGLAVLARGGQHLTLERQGGRVVAVLSSEVADRPYMPSVNMLFRSAARIYGKRTLAVVMTGMGDDGLSGAKAVHEAGGAILVEAESSCAVYGMPRVVWEAGIASDRAPVDLLGRRLVQRVMG
jgi:two-component system chemotaxis response regulator CheB